MEHIQHQPWIHTKTFYFSFILLVNQIGICNMKTKTAVTQKLAWNKND